MRRIIILAAMMLSYIFGLAAQTENTPTQFQLLGAEKYALDAYYSAEMQELFVTCEFEVPRTGLRSSRGYGILLDREAKILSCAVAGKSVMLYLVNDLQPAHFWPETVDSMFLVQDSPARFFGLPLADLPASLETVPIRLSYQLTVPPFQQENAKRLAAVFDANRFWYPRNTFQESTVNLVLTTMPSISVLIGNAWATKTDSQFSRKQALVFIDAPVQPSSLRLVRD